MADVRIGSGLAQFGSVTYGKAPGLVQFGSVASGEVPGSEIDPDVPLPGSFLVKVYNNLDLSAVYAPFPSTQTRGSRLQITTGNASSAPDLAEVATFDMVAYLELWSDFAQRAGLKQSTISAVVNQYTPRATGQGNPALPGTLDDEATRWVAEFGLINLVTFALLKTGQNKALYGKVALPVKGADGAPHPQFFDPSNQVVVEQTFRVSVFPTRYGVGKTVHTVSLLPGEEQQLALKTWRTSKTTSTNTNSVVDSFDDSAKDSFQNELDGQQQQGSTSDNKLAWNVQASASASFFGMASASVSGGASGEQKLSTSESVQAISKALRDHTAQVNRNRKATIENTTTDSTEQGEENSITRTIKNVNLRRTLNFVFRELNQIYETIIHLEDIRVGVGTGIPGDLTIVPLPRARQLFGPQTDAVVYEVVRQYALAFDDADTPRQVLQAMDAPDWKPVADNPGLFDRLPPIAKSLDVSSYSSVTRRWRFRRNDHPDKTTVAERDAIGQDNMSPKVAGLVVARDEAVLKTPCVVVEALLGAFDALDGFAMRMQEATVADKELANDKSRLAVGALVAPDAPDGFAKRMQEATVVEKEVSNDKARLAEDVVKAAADKVPAFASVFYPPPTTITEK